MMIFPFIILLALAFPLILAVLAGSRAQLCRDMLAGIVLTELPSRALLAQEARATRTASWAWFALFGLSLFFTLVIQASLPF